MEGGAGAGPRLLARRKQVRRSSRPSRAGAPPFSLQPLHLLRLPAFPTPTPKVGPYHTLYPLEDLSAAEEHPSSALGVRTCVIKGVSAHDGGAYALRRVDGKQVGALCLEGGQRLPRRGRPVSGRAHRQARAPPARPTHPPLCRRRRRPAPPRPPPPGAAERRAPVQRARRRRGVVAAVGPPRARHAPRGLRDRGPRRRAVAGGGARIPPRGDVGRAGAPHAGADGIGAARAQHAQRGGAVELHRAGWRAGEQARGSYGRAGSAKVGPGRCGDAERAGRRAAASVPGAASPLTAAPPSRPAARARSCRLRCARCTPPASPCAPRACRPARCSCCPSAACASAASGSQRRWPATCRWRARSCCRRSVTTLR
jgi:hypothetical protein